jgi:DNA-binding protein YbaB
MTTALTSAMRESERRAREIERVWQALDEVEETVESPDGYVVVTVDARGSLRGLRLDPRIYRGDTATLAAAITDAVAEAAEFARQRALVLLRPLLPVRVRADDADLAFDPVLAELDRMRR